MREQHDHAGHEALAASIEANAIEFTEEQKASLRDAFFEAELALLRRIVGEASEPANFESPRKIGALVTALQGVRSMASQSPTALWAVSRGGWFGYAPDTGAIYSDEDEDD